MGSGVTPRRGQEGQRGVISALRVRGPFHGPTGYDHHVREFVRELHRVGVAVQLVDVPEWGLARLPAHLQDPWFDSLGSPVDALVDLHFCMPFQVRARRDAVTVNYTMFEATHVPPSWVTQNLTHDLVVVPTESSRRAWAAAGFPSERVAVSPLGVNADLYGQPASPLTILDQQGRPIDRYRVRVLNVSELSPRKNVLGLMRAWIAATSPADDAVLLVKLGRYQQGQDAAFEAGLRAVQIDLRKSLAHAAPVLFVSTLFTDAEMPRLYASATHYLSLSFGEGWDQAMVEAAAAGLRLVAPRHSAYEAYLDDTIARLVACHEAPADRWLPPGVPSLFAGTYWWEPDHDDACRAIRAAIDGHDRPAASARERVLGGMSWADATRSLLDVLAAAAADGSRR